MIKRRKFKNTEKICENLRTFKTIYKLCKLLELYKASHMLAPAEQSGSQSQQTLSPQIIHVSVTIKTSKICQILQSTLIKSILVTGFNSSQSWEHSIYIFSQFSLCAKLCSFLCQAHGPYSWSLLPFVVPFWRLAFTTDTQSSLQRLLLPLKHPPSDRAAPSGAVLQVLPAVSPWAAQLEWDQETKAAGAKTLHSSSTWGSWA